jgi:predicted Zn-ribbon and HTH transcriptional regulator
VPRNPEAIETVRRRLLRWLDEDEYDFEALRDALDLGVRDLERHLRHVEKTLRARGSVLRVTAPHCRDCGFGFPGRTAKHLHPPGRCPRCRGERIDPPRFRATAR